MDGSIQISLVNIPVLAFAAATRPPRLYPEVMIVGPLPSRSTASRDCRVSDCMLPVGEYTVHRSRGM